MSEKVIVIYRNKKSRKITHIGAYDNEKITVEIGRARAEAWKADDENPCFAEVFGVDCPPNFDAIFEVFEFARDNGRGQSDVERIRETLGNLEMDFADASSTLGVIDLELGRLRESIKELIAAQNEKTLAGIQGKRGAK